MSATALWWISRGGSFPPSVWLSTKTAVSRALKQQSPSPGGRHSIINKHTSIEAQEIPPGYGDYVAENTLSLTIASLWLEGKDYISTLAQSASMSLIWPTWGFFLFISYVTLKQVTLEWSWTWTCSSGVSGCTDDWWSEKALCHYVLARSPWWGMR